MEDKRSFDRLMVGKSTWNHATIHVFGAEPVIITPDTKVKLQENTLDIFIDNVPNMYPMSQAEAEGNPLIGEATIIVEKKDILYITFWMAKKVQPTPKVKLTDVAGNDLKSV